MAEARAEARAEAHEAHQAFVACARTASVDECALASSDMLPKPVHNDVAVAPQRHLLSNSANDDDRLTLTDSTQVKVHYDVTFLVKENTAVGGNSTHSSAPETSRTFL